MANASSIQILARQLNFVVRQNNSCRTFGPRKDLLDTFRPEKGSEVFVAKLPSDAFEDEIFPFFSKVGPIYKIKMILTLDNRPSTKGYCFVEYMNPMTAQRAIKVLHNTCLRPNHTIVIDLSTDHKNLVVTNAADHVTEATIVKDMNKAQLEGPEAITQISEGFFLLEFSEHRLALLAVKALPLVVQNWGTNAAVNWEYNPEVIKRLDHKRLHQQHQQLRRMVPTHSWQTPLSVLPSAQNAAFSTLSPDSGLGSYGSNGYQVSSNEASPTYGNVVSNTSVMDNATNAYGSVSSSDYWSPARRLARQEKLPFVGPWCADYGCGGFGGANPHTYNVALKAFNLPDITREARCGFSGKTKVPPGLEKSLSEESVKDKSGQNFSYFSKWPNTTAAQSEAPAVYLMGVSLASTMQHVQYPAPLPTAMQHPAVYGVDLKGHHDNSKHTPQDDTDKFWAKNPDCCDKYEEFVPALHANKSAPHAASSYKQVAPLYNALSAKENGRMVAGKRFHEMTSQKDNFDCEESAVPDEYKPVAKPTVSSVKSYQRSPVHSDYGTASEEDFATAKEVLVGQVLNLHLQYKDDQKNEKDKLEDRQRMDALLDQLTKMHCRQFKLPDAATTAAPAPRPASPHPYIVRHIGVEREHCLPLHCARAFLAQETNPKKKPNRRNFREM